MDIWSCFTQDIISHLWANGPALLRHYYYTLVYSAVCYNTDLIWFSRVCRLCRGVTINSHLSMGSMCFCLNTTWLTV